MGINKTDIQQSPSGWRLAVSHDPQFENQENLGGKKTKKSEKKNSGFDMNEGKLCAQVIASNSKFVSLYFYVFYL